MSLDNATPEEWDRVSKTSVGKLYHPNDKHNPVTQPDHYNKGAIALKQSRRPCTRKNLRAISRVTA
jgi:hypothetical protein